MASICLGLNVLTVCISYTCTSDRTIVKHANILFYYNDVWHISRLSCNKNTTFELKSLYYAKQKHYQHCINWYNAPFFISTSPQFPCTCAFYMEPTRLFLAESSQVRHANLYMALQLYHKMLQTLYLAGLFDILYGLVHAQGRLWNYISESMESE